jgi:type I restriction enzyme M protein
MPQSPLPLSPLTLDELEAHLWEAANILRGSPVDRTDWKGYILPLLFFKRICDVWDEEYQAALDTYGEDFADEHRFQIPEGCHWQRVRETAANVGTALQNAMRGIEAANQKHLYGVFGDAQWTNKERLPDPLLKDLIEHFSALNLGNQRITTDVIGDAYEFLIKKFADATNKKAGEFYTPRSVVRLMVAILDPQEGESVYDPTCGTAGMLLVVILYVTEKGGDPRTLLGKLYGQEKERHHRCGGAHEPAAARHRRLCHRAGRHAAQPGVLRPGDRGAGDLRCVLANLPFSLEQWGRELWEKDPWGRAFAGLPTDSSGDYAFIQHMVKSMAPITGRMAVVVPQGALFRGGVEGQIRRKLLEMDLIEAVIGLAPNLFYGTGLAACILVLRQRKRRRSGRARC